MTNNLLNTEKLIYAILSRIQLPTLFVFHEKRHRFFDKKISSLIISPSRRIKEESINNNAKFMMSIFRIKKDEILEQLIAPKEEFQKTISTIIYSKEWRSSVKEVSDIPSSIWISISSIIQFQEVFLLFPNINKSTQTIDYLIYPNYKLEEDSDSDDSNSFSSSSNEQDDEKEETFSTINKQQKNYNDNAKLDSLEWSVLCYVIAYEFYLFVVGEKLNSLPWIDEVSCTDNKKHPDEMNLFISPNSNYDSSFRRIRIYRGKRLLTSNSGNSKIVRNKKKVLLYPLKVFGRPTWPTTSEDEGTHFVHPPPMKKQKTGTDDDDEIDLDYINDFSITKETTSPATIDKIINSPTNDDFGNRSESDKSCEESDKQPSSTKRASDIDSDAILKLYLLAKYIIESYDKLEKDDDNDSEGRNEPIITRTYFLDHLKNEYVFKQYCIDNELEPRETTFTSLEYNPINYIEFIKHFRSRLLDHYLVDDKNLLGIRNMKKIVHKQRNKRQIRNATPNFSLFIHRPIVLDDYKPMTFDLFDRRRNSSPSHYLFNGGRITINNTSTSSSSSKTTSNNDSLSAVIMIFNRTTSSREFKEQADREDDNSNNNKYLDQHVINTIVSPIQVYYSMIYYQKSLSIFLGKEDHQSSSSDKTRRVFEISYNRHEIRVLIPLFYYRIIKYHLMPYYIKINSFVERNVYLPIYPAQCTYFLDSTLEKTERKMANLLMMRSILSYFESTNVDKDNTLDFLPSNIQDPSSEYVYTILPRIICQYKRDENIWQSLLDSLHKEMKRHLSETLDDHNYRLKKEDVKRIIHIYDHSLFTAIVSFIKCNTIHYMDLQIFKKLATLFQSNADLCKDFKMVYNIIRKMSDDFYPQTTELDVNSTAISLKTRQLVEIPYIDYGNAKVQSILRQFGAIRKSSEEQIRLLRKYKSVAPFVPLHMHIYIMLADPRFKRYLGMYPEKDIICIFESIRLKDFKKHERMDELFDRSRPDIHIPSPVTLRESQASLKLENFDLNRFKIPHFYHNFYTQPRKEEKMIINKTYNNNSIMTSFMGYRLDSYESTTNRLPTEDDKNAFSALLRILEIISCFSTNISLYNGKTKKQRKNTNDKKKEVINRYLVSFKNIPLRESKRTETLFLSNYNLYMPIRAEFENSEIANCIDFRTQVTKNPTTLIINNNVKNQKEALNINTKRPEVGSILEPITLNNSLALINNPYYESIHTTIILENEKEKNLHLVEPFIFRCNREVDSFVNLPFNWSYQDLLPVILLYPVIEFKK